MRFVKISALALLLSVPMGAGLASATDLSAAPKHHWLHFHKHKHTHAHAHPILTFLKALCHKS